MRTSIWDYEEDCSDNPYLEMIRTDPNPAKVARKGSIWTTIFHLLFGKRRPVMTKKDMNFRTWTGIVLFIVGFLSGCLFYYPHKHYLAVTIGEMTEHPHYWLSFVPSMVGAVLITFNLGKRKKR